MECALEVVSPSIHSVKEKLKMSEETGKGKGLEGKEAPCAIPSQKCILWERGLVKFPQP